MRQVYHEHVREHLESEGIAFVDKAISAPGAAFIEQVMGQRRRTSMRVLDMGIGFSTMVFARWMERQPDAWTMDYVGVEHDASWCAFVSRLPGMGPDQQLVARRPHDHGSPRWRKDGFDVIVVDHGDGKGTDLDTRAKDTPWLATMLRPDGIMLFDDWRPKHEGRIRRALPNGWRIGAAEWTRRYPRDKAIGWAVRERS